MNELISSAILSAISQSTSHRIKPDSVVIYKSEAGHNALSSLVNAVAGHVCQVLAQRQTPGIESFQERVGAWVVDCFGPEIAKHGDERNHRFLEESLELVQSLGCTAAEAHELVDYVFNRKVGVPYQEVGGVMVTLAALCEAQCLNMVSFGEVELARINNPEVTEKIRLKQATKPKNSARPQ